MNQLTVRTEKELFPVSEDLYGIFFEDINRAGDGGLYPEMLRNRSFEDSILPEGCTPVNGKDAFISPTGWKDTFHNGEGMHSWTEGQDETDIPAWYSENAEITLNEKYVLNKNRKAALEVKFKAGGSIYNIGYHGISVQKGEAYDFYMFIRTLQEAATADLQVMLMSADKKEKIYAADPVKGITDSYACVRFQFTADMTDHNAVLAIQSENEAHILIGYSSLMPHETYLGHGLRKDLMEMLAELHPAFVRFPGGCVVEGFTKETMLRFPYMTGPVWERPSQTLLWHYRTSNGLGFHEYLQMCEDLHSTAIYVINAGMTCQARCSQSFSGDFLEELLQEAIDAIAYATDPADTVWGKKRAKAGHPTPFSMKYVEIGNENSGKDYQERYDHFYKVLKEKYPQITFIANAHLEKDGSTCEMVDEHFYANPQYFMNSRNVFKGYDRKQPKIFIGEYAANEYPDMGNVRSALSEAVFLLGIENNQDIIRMTSYAPLLENAGFRSWEPNLIVFNNHAVYGLPVYHVLKCLAAKRGKKVISGAMCCLDTYEITGGLPGIMTSGEGVKVKGMKCNGLPIRPSHFMCGKTEENTEEQVCEIIPGAAPDLQDTDYAAWDKMGDITFGKNEELKNMTLEGEILVPNADMEVALTWWDYSGEIFYKTDESSTERGEWQSMFTARTGLHICKGKADIRSTRLMHDNMIGKEKEVSIQYGEFQPFKLIISQEHVDCYLNGELIQSEDMPSCPVLSSVVTADEDAVYIKLVNIGQYEETLQIALDCEVASDYEVMQVSSGKTEDQNSFLHPQKVSAQVFAKQGAHRTFTHVIPADSFQILTLKRDRR